MNVSFTLFCFVCRERETIDVERKLRYDFMYERCQKEMPEERKMNRVFFLKQIIECIV